VGTRQFERRLVWLILRSPTVVEIGSGFLFDVRSENMSYRVFAQVVNPVQADALRQLRLFGDFREFQGPLRCGNSLREAVGFRIGCGQRIQVTRMLATSQLAGFFRKPDRLWAVAELSVLMRGQQPGEALEGFGPLRLQPKGRSIACDSFGNLSLGGEGEGEVVLGREAVPSNDLTVHHFESVQALLCQPGVVAGSDKDFGIIATVQEAARLAVTVTKTLRDVYGAPHPAFLTYVAQDATGAPVASPALATARPLMAQTSTAGLPALTEGSGAAGEGLPLAERVATIVATMMKTQPEALQVDKDGDIGIRSGSAMVFVRVRDNPPLIDVFSPILTELEASEKLYVKLSELTTKMPIGRLYFVNKTVWASVPVLGRDFQPTHLMLALQVMTGLADELDDRLHGEFGGRRFFVESDATTPDPVPDSDANIGMYL
jgi:hypothetical protein